MARKAARCGEDDGPPTDNQRQNDHPKSHDNGGVYLGRRGCLKLGAAAIAAGTGAAALPGSTLADTEEYETIRLEPGEQRVHYLADGESFENVLIDQTAEGAMFAIRVEDGANDWAIRSVGWKGVAPTGGSREFVFLIYAQGDGVIENIFIDQRNHNGGVGSDVGGIWTYSDAHHGHIECRHNFIAGCGNNGSYDSGDGWDHYAAEGILSHEYCYHRDNTPSNFRPGKPGSYVRNCVSIANDPEGTRGPYPGNSDTQLTRACWAWHNPDIVMENCSIWWDPDDVQPAPPFWVTHSSDSEGTEGELHVIDCDINASWEEAGNKLTPDNFGGSGSSTRSVHFDGLGNDPDISVLGDGVPTTPEMAAAGMRNLPPELGTAPSGGVGEFGQAEAEVDDTDDSAPEELARPAEGGQANSGTAQIDDDDVDVRSAAGVLMGSSLATLGATTYAIRRQFDWKYR